MAGGSEALAPRDELRRLDLDREVDRAVRHGSRPARVVVLEQRRWEPRPARRRIRLGLDAGKDQLSAPDAEVRPASLRVLERDRQAEPIAVERRHGGEIPYGELHLEHPERRGHTIERTVRHQFASIHELARIELLAGLPGETLERLAGRMERRPLRPGDVLYESEDERGRFTVVVNGMLRARGGTIIRPGEALGGLTVFGEPVQAMVPSVVASCDQETFDELVRPLLTS